MATDWRRAVGAGAACCGDARQLEPQAPQQDPASAEFNQTVQTKLDQRNACCPAAGPQRNHRFDDVIQHGGNDQAKANPQPAVGWRAGRNHKLSRPLGLLITSTEP